MKDLGQKISCFLSQNFRMSKMGQNESDFSLISGAFLSQILLYRDLGQDLLLFLSQFSYIEILGKTLIK